MLILNKTIIMLIITSQRFSQVSLIPVLLAKLVQSLHDCSTLLRSAVTVIRLTALTPKIKKLSELALHPT